jgi:hypothetical protein
MKRDKAKPSMKPFSYRSLLERRDPLMDIHIDQALPHGRTLSPEEAEEQKKQYRRFLLMQTLRS